MIGIDTNILLRFVLADDAGQFSAAQAFFAERNDTTPAYVSLLVTAEVIWNLATKGYSKAEIATAFRNLLDAEGLVFEAEDFLDVLFDEKRTVAADFSDHIIAHLAEKAGCSSTVTFDRKAAKNVPGMELLT
jgi:predicted nucleic-acid-binding protein